MRPEEREADQEARLGLKTVSSLAGLGLADMEALLAELGEPPFRARQLFQWVFVHGVESYDAMTNLPRALRNKLAERLPVRSTHVVDKHDSDDDTFKLLVGLKDGETVECVLIPEGERQTACLSSQVGCGVGCVFCASGADGVVRNLDAAEIVEQLLHLRTAAGRRVTNIVMMGMGEPLHNAEAVIAALRLFRHPDGIDIGARHITVSTSGPERGFDRLLEEGMKINLAISLHAAFDDLRKELVPKGGTAGVATLSGMARRWFERTGRDVTLEYVLIDGVNDSDRDAEALARLCGPHRNVNLIPMNPVSFAPALKAPPRARTEKFADLLRRRGAVVNLRRQRGDDVAAACGQLRRTKAQP
ncbi:MAG: dual-specificity RNA methyltransferase RlmN [Planctomycetota bacterium]